MSPENINKTLINSDYPLDKIIFQKEDSYVAPTGFSQYQVDHNLLFTPLPKAVWSTDPGFAVTYNIGDGIPDPDPSVLFTIQVVDISSNAGKIFVTVINSGVPTTIYIKLYAFMPSNVSLEAPFTDILADPFTINSDYNYTKLYSVGVTASSSTPSSTETVGHGLGYLPQTDVWYVRDGYTYLMSYLEVVSGTPDSDAARLTTSSLVMFRSPYISGPEYFHYRIYVDEL